MKLNLAARRLLLASSILMTRCAAAGKWIQIGSDIDGENPRDFAGGTQGALAMSRDGMTVAVGAAVAQGPAYFSFFAFAAWAPKRMFRTI